MAAYRRLDTATHRHMVSKETIALLHTTHHTYHHAECEGLLRVGVRRHVPEADGGHAGHGEVEGGHVHRPQLWPVLDLG